MKARFFIVNFSDPAFAINLIPDIQLFKEREVTGINFTWLIFNFEISNRTSIG